MFSGIFYFSFEVLSLLACRASGFVLIAKHLCCEEHRRSARTFVRMLGRLRFVINKRDRGRGFCMWLPDWSLVARLESLNFAAAQEK